MHGERIAAVDREQWHGARRGRRLALYAGLPVFPDCRNAALWERCVVCKCYLDRNLTQHADWEPRRNLDGLD